MNKKQQYTPPVIRQAVSIEGEQAILSGSVVEAFNEGGVTTTGQEVEAMDFSNETQFSHDWE